MDTISMNSKSSKTSDPHRLLLLSLGDKIDLIKNINILFYQILAFTIHRKIFKSLISLIRGKSHYNNTFKMSAPIWNEEFGLPDGLYSISDIQNYFEYIFKKHVENTANPSIRIYINKIENRITLKIKTQYYVKLLTPETMNLLGSTKSKIAKDKNGENVPDLEVTEVVY